MLTHESNTFPLVYIHFLQTSFTATEQDMGMRRMHTGAWQGEAPEWRYSDRVLIYSQSAPSNLQDTV